MSTAEEWRVIPGYSDYEVSDLGRVRSYRDRWGRLEVPKMRALKKWSSPASLTTYRRVRIVSDEGVWRYRQVHLLVLEAFVGPRPDGMVTRHLNGDGSDNRLANLRYGTPKENGADRIKHGRHAGARKTHCPQGHPYSGDNLRVGGPNGNTRSCRTCARLKMRESRSKRRAAAAAA